jgi:hypothetical protein
LYDAPPRSIGKILRPIPETPEAATELAEALLWPMGQFRAGIHAAALPHPRALNANPDPTS